MPDIDPRESISQVFRAGVTAADPERATRQAVRNLGGIDAPTWVIAIGKGAHRMASGAVRALHERRIPIPGGVVIAHENDPAGTHELSSCVGDHPTPGPNSFLAAQGLAELASHTTADADALVLISGGTTSLIASPIDGISHTDVVASFDALLASGADITLMNAIRKRLLRFAAGRLAIALGTRRIHCLIASDVIGNDLSAIGSGPCVPDHTTARDVRHRARVSNAWDSIPDSARALLDAMADGRSADVPPANHPRFATTSAKVILDRGDAVRGAVGEAERLGYQPEVMPEPLAGEAAVAGRQFVSTLLGHPAVCIIWSGETTVTLGSAKGKGGRCQEFALAAAIELERESAGLTILAAGTDGRDGPTDAAGAVVDAGTCARMRARGIDPLQALASHDSHAALDAAAALLKTGPTGTNVNDLVIALKG